MADRTLAHRLRYALLLPILAVPVSAWPSDVTACRSDTETGSGKNLASALLAGGDVFIRCPSGSRIHVTRGYDVFAATQIIGMPTDNGSANIVLDGSGTQGPLLRVVHAGLTIQNLEISNFTKNSATGDPVAVIPGSARVIFAQHAPLFNPTIIQSKGDVELDHVTIDNSHNPVGVTGNLTAKNSVFRSNTGNSLVASGTVTIDHSTFSQNERGVLMDAGSVTYSQFDHNTVRAVDILFPSGQVTVRDSGFTANGGVAVGVSAQSSPNGGGSVLLRNNTFDSNSSAAGALTIAAETIPLPVPPTDPANDALAHLPAGKIQVLYSNFLSNTGLAGAILATLRVNQDTLDLGGDAFLKNQSSQPVSAALTVAGGLVTISHTLFKGNIGVQASAIAATDTTLLTMSNSLVVENVGSGGAAADAAAISAVILELSNVTIANNQETGVRVNVSSSGTARNPILALATFSNVIIAGNGRACDLKSDLPPLKGANLVFPNDNSCPGATIIEDPVLDSFYIPSPGSAALAQGDPKVCAAAPVGLRDIVFQMRTGSTCALGAFERPPPRFVVQPTPDALAQLGRATQKP